MIEAVFLDTGPLGVLAQRPNKNDEVKRCQAWLKSLLAVGVPVIVPEIADYELRRELVRTVKNTGIPDPVDRLDKLLTEVEYLPLDTKALRLAADLWAEARNQGVAPPPTDSRSMATSFSALRCSSILCRCPASLPPQPTSSTWIGLSMPLSGRISRHE